MSTNELDRKRFHVIGHADTNPVKGNDTRENRAYNRRVEIIITQGDKAVGADKELSENQ